MLEKNCAPNRAPMRGILKIMKKMALPCGPSRNFIVLWLKIALLCSASSNFHRSFVQSRVSCAERPEDFDVF